MAADTTQADRVLVVHDEGPVRVLRINRPQALNAVTSEVTELPSRRSRTFSAPRPFAPWS
ncbi:hypothetical protein [Aeromicrobium sp. UC242_57]|uniref:hypothetical protein n=1 Tax=Aeromicrobium sp. UC242_57 TaxID=3374624 RepID=UPI0037B0A35D